MRNRLLIGSSLGLLLLLAAAIAKAALDIIIEAISNG